MFLPLANISWKKPTCKQHRDLPKINLFYKWQVWIGHGKVSRGFPDCFISVKRLQLLLILRDSFRGENVCYSRLSVKSEIRWAWWWWHLPNVFVNQMRQNCVLLCHFGDDAIMQISLITPFVQVYVIIQITEIEAKCCNFHHLLIDYIL